MKKSDQPLVEQIITALNTNDRAVERAIVILGNNTTVHELRSRDAEERNGVGFSKAHSKFGVWAYQRIMAGQHLHGEALQKARQFALRYARTQLLTAAKEKLNGKP